MTSNNCNNNSSDGDSAKILQDPLDIDVLNEAKQEYAKNIVADRILKYIKLDDIMKRKEKEHRAEIKTIKETKSELEEYIIGYLDEIQQEYLVVGKQNKLTKQVRENKSPIKQEYILKTLQEGFKQHNLCKSDDECAQIINSFVKNIEESRTIKLKKTLKRTNPESKTQKKTKPTTS